MERRGNMSIKDSGARRLFAGGAVRDINSDDKGRCDLLPLDVVGEIFKDWGDTCANGKASNVFDQINLFQQTGEEEHLEYALYSFMQMRGWHGWSDMFLDVAVHYAEGAKKYSENNWKLGINTKSYVDSAVRHCLKWLRGDKDEPHDRAFVFNILGCIWTCRNKPEYNDYAKSEEEGG
jgi:hypothetical protein